MALQPVRLVRPVALGRLIGSLQCGVHLVEDRLRALGWHAALRGQRPGIELARRLQAVDGAVHDRLGEGRLVGLVMAVPAVAHDVEHHVGAERHPVFCRHARGKHNRLGIISVDVQDRRLDRFGHIRAVEAGIGVRRYSRKTDLVVDHEMHRAAGAIADELAHRQRLVDQPLAGERGVAVHQNRHDRAPRSHVAGHVLSRPHLADHHRIDRFEVRRVGLQRDVDLAPGDLEVGRGAEMVFHVTRALHVVGLEAGAPELAEHRGQRLFHDVDEGVEPAAMRHADRHLVHAAFDRHTDDRVQGRDGDLAALQAEPLGGDIAALAERLERLGLGELTQHRLLLGRRERCQPRRAFHLALDPGFLIGVLDVHELNAERAAIRFAEDGDDLAQRRGLAAEHVVDEDRPIHVGFGETVGARVELGMRLGHLQPERVELGLEMAAHAVDAHQHQGADRVEDGGTHLVSRHCTRRGGRRPGGAGGGRLVLEGEVARRPGGTGRVGQDRAGFVIQGGEQIGKTLVHRVGIGDPARVHVGDERRVAAIEGGGQDVDACHLLFPSVMDEWAQIVIVTCTGDDAANGAGLSPAHARPLTPALSRREGSNTPSPSGEGWVRVSRAAP